jgi:hypothetical protein
MYSLRVVARYRTDTQTDPQKYTHLYPLSNHAITDDLQVQLIKVVIQQRTIHHNDKLGSHTNPILQTLLEQQIRRALKKLWSADLIDG